MSNTADIVAQRIAANQDFLRNSYKRKQRMNFQTSPTWEAGKQIVMTAPIVPGWATKVRVFYDLKVTVALNGGTAKLNAAAPYNLFSNVAVDFSGQTHRNHHGYWLKVLQQSYRGLIDILDSAAWADAIIGDGTVSTHPLENGDNIWRGYVDIPLQIEETNTAGMVPLGESATPLTVRLTLPTTFVGDDPMNNVVSVASGAQITSVSGTINAYVEYRYGQSVHSPAIRPARPYIGSFAKITEGVVNLTQNQDYNIILHRQPYPYLKLMQAVVLGNGKDRFCEMSKIGGYKFMLDPATCMYDYSPSGAGIAGLVADQRILYHHDLDEGIILMDFVAGTNPEVPNGVNTPNIGNYNAAQSEILYLGTLSGNSDRIISAEMYLEPLPY